ncbi:YqiA/YcfP family alpha/beta fold hydrolase [Microbulbifer sp. MLAF003]|uniref:YqiA/YcfP family alpha/beta fold hydrolase n=1 Tax=Microbulbifer sp. MLAF003 TaxID=3032582 RepID=UPI0024AE2244|nr:YqiA/YcfP family alpha/beta fold hydrolase [Microbulbifer sp. MLAF003]WHI51652.1 YqiA/YcfP family alpha/beta fold hydrolase [Microbulbifer sp. MLAF003]
MQTQDSKGRPLLIYLHGFLSSPQSFKCQLMREQLGADHPSIIFCAPQISPYPAIAQQSLVSLLKGFLKSADCGPIGLVGSSMGGFWCTYLGERFNLPAVLINPAVRPSRFMPAYIGQVLRPYSGEQRDYRLGRGDVDTMEHLEAELPSPLSNRYWLLAQRGDETLDYRDAEDFYRGQRQTIEDGGDHSFQGFARYCDPIVEFLFNQ